MDVVDTLYESTMNSLTKLAKVIATTIVNIHLRPFKEYLNTTLKILFTGWRLFEFAAFYSPKCQGYEKQSSNCTDH